MREFSTEFAEHLQREVTTLCWCWKLERTDGLQTLGFTNHDQIISYDGLDYNPCDGLTEESRSEAEGLQETQSTIRGILSDDRITDTDILAGKWDNATVTIDRVNWKDSSVRENIYVMNIGSIQKQGSRFTAEMQSAQQGLNRKVGRIFQKRCDAALGDRRCRINLDEGTARKFWHRDSSVVTVISQSELVFDWENADDALIGGSGLSGSVFPAVPDKFFNSGYIEFLDGENINLKIDIKSHQQTRISLWIPAVFPISIGASIRVYAGCDKSVTHCRDKFNNLVNHQGFPLIPTRDQILPYGRRNRGYDGSSFFKGQVP